MIDMMALNLQKRTFAVVENGSWAPKSGSLMNDFLNNELKSMTVLNDVLTIHSAMNEDKLPEMDALADSIIESMK